MRQLWTMTASDLRQHLRDRSVVIFALIVPAALMFVFNLTFGAVSDIELQPVVVAASVPADDELAAALVESLGSVEGLDVTVKLVRPDEVGERVRSGEAQYGVVVPAGFGADVAAGNGPAVEVTEGDGSTIETDILTSVVNGVLDRFTAGTVAATAGGLAGLPPDRLAGVAREAATAGPEIVLSEGEAASEQLTTSGALVAGQAGLFLLFTVGFGVLGLLAEREQGTMARLLSMPMRPWLVVAAKGLVGYLLGVVATGVLLTFGSLFFEVSFGSPAVVAVLVACVAAAGTSMLFIVARLARTAEQASVLQSIIALVLGMAGGAFFPIAATGFAAKLLDLNPVAAFTRGLGISSSGGGLADVAGTAGIMLGFAAVCAAASLLVPDRGRAL